MSRIILVALTVGALTGPPDLQPVPDPPLSAEDEVTLSLAHCELGDIAEAAFLSGDEPTRTAAFDLQTRIERRMGRDCALIVRRHIPAYRASRLYRATGSAPQPAAA